MLFPSFTFLKMKKYLPLFFILLISCSKSPKNEIPIFNNLSFRILHNEHVTAIDDSIKNNYLKKIEHKKSQIPLFRCIQGNEYYMYIGIPFNTSFNSLVSNKLFGTSINVLSDSSTFKYEVLKSDSIFTTELVLNINSNLLYILCETESGDIQHEMLNKDSLIQRITLK